MPKTKTDKKTAGNRPLSAVSYELVKKYPLDPPLATQLIPFSFYDIPFIPPIPIPEKVAELAQLNQMNIVQHNGQRYLGPYYKIHPYWSPPKGSEVYVRKIPRNLDETTLFPIVSKIGLGPIFQLRLMMDFSGSNRGYCYIKYFHPAQADLAINALNGYQIEENKFLQASKSVDNARLIMTGIPFYKKNHEIYYELNSFSAGVDRVWKEYANGQTSVMVEYINHRAAAIARSNMLAAKYRPWGFTIDIQWAKPVDMYAWAIPDKTQKALPQPPTSLSATVSSNPEPSINDLAENQELVQPSTSESSTSESSTSETSTLETNDTSISLSEQDFNMSAMLSFLKY